MAMANLPVMVMANLPVMVMANLPVMVMANLPVMVMAKPPGDGDGEPPGDGDGEPPGDGDGEPPGDGDDDMTTGGNMGECALPNSGTPCEDDSDCSLFCQLCNLQTGYCENDRWDGFSQWNDLVLPWNYRGGYALGPVSSFGRFI